MVSKRGKRGNSAPATTNQPTATSTSAEQPSPDESSTTMESETPPPSTALSPPQFTLLICLSLAFTHILDISKSINTAKDIMAQGVIAPENITAIPVNATEYCAKHFQNMTEIIAETKEEFVAQFGCTVSDLSILNFKYQTSLLRIALSSVTSLLCWGDQALLKSWSFAYAIFILCTLGGYLVQYEYLKGNEKFSLVAMLVLILTSNRSGRQGRLKFDVDEGLYNLVLFFLVVLMSYILSNHLIFGVEEFTNFTAEDITPGGKASWLMTVIVEYSILMIVSAFALMYFDEGRKRSLLIFMSFITVYHAFIQLPSQKDFWIEASTRQNYVMIIFAIMLAGALLPSFDQFVIKK
mmetsp:Transcript_18506/g.23294  ORF Transcript_18506/g.23294 Transcript_18506/m.23294 type:complete len:352 (+) Transcript_18506:208-1263(+)|eukprot:CAMPEP_0203694852 /NCGR_PEP_ID=MMETSP0091-20130426/6478_1 /ASSEMBLY_ACC=CAM_ASM_001089 /TAXON_ID=426623 /ORGANISM="Chaetoceros affinis, Strain CCMP159" /LENGTH=351 /DNA_ID=CAMNT_0050566289 /DNA_START=133 /DNA_END=1188 /DNA_ORIENTATION=-